MLLDESRAVVHWSIEDEVTMNLPSDYIMKDSLIWDYSRSGARGAPQVSQTVILLFLWRLE